MAKVRICSIGVSLDGFAAGPSQSEDHPLGVDGQALMAWAQETQAFKQMIGQPGGAPGGVDEQMFKAGFDGIGAWVIGRNMFGPDRGPWGASPWRGWWGENPPFHRPVIVLTHHPRPPLEMQGGTTFHFVTEGIETALARALEAAGGLDVRIGGGARVLRQYLVAGLVDEMHLAVAPVLLGGGEPLFEGLDLAAAGYQCRRVVAGEAATHYLISRAADG